MNRALPLFIILVGATLTGCKTDYWSMRKDDLKDIFGCTLVKGYGWDIKGGPIEASLCKIDDKVGYRNGVRISDRIRSSELGLLFVSFDSIQAKHISKGQQELLRQSREYKGSGFFGISVGTEPNTGRLRLYHLTSCEASLAIGYGLRLGFNPGEVVDLLLGFFGVDIYDDDSPALMSAKLSETTDVFGLSSEVSHFARPTRPPAIAVR